jgi:hypothetical protein
LRTYFARQGEEESAIDARIAELAGEMVSASDRALAHAWLLARFSQRLDALRPESLPAQTRLWAAAMARDHAQSAFEETRRLRLRLHEILAPAGPAAGEVALDRERMESHSLLESSQMLLQEVSNHNEAVHAAFLPDAEGRMLPSPVSFEMIERRALWIAHSSVQPDFLRASKE